MAATSARDPRVVRATRLLRDERARHEERAFVLDGEDLLHEALAAGIEVELVLAAERLDVAAPVEVAAPDALRALAALGQPPRVVAVCRIPDPPPDELPPRSLVLARVTGAGNVGSIVRTAAAFGVPRVALTPGCADPWSRKALRAAMGATFARGLVATDRPLAGLAEHATLAAAVRHGGRHPAELPPRAVVVFGSERDGLTPEEVALCSLAVTIPAGGFESLNVSAAAAIVTYEQARDG